MSDGEIRDQAGRAVDGEGQHGAIGARAPDLGGVVIGRAQPEPRLRDHGRALFGFGGHGGSAGAWQRWDGVDMVVAHGWRKIDDRSVRAASGADPGRGWEIDAVRHQQ